MNNNIKQHWQVSIKQALSIFFLLSLYATSGFAQQINPLESDPRAARAGGVIFRAQCATCHGADARGISSIDAPDLTLMFTREETTDGSVFDTIQQGIPGSIMPPHGFPDAEIWMLVSYLKSVAVGGSQDDFEGDSDLGRNLFAANCSRCHRASGGGGSLGPALGSITARRSRAALINSVRMPNSSIGRSYKPVELLMADGSAVSGTLKSEDAFSIQIMDSDQQLRAFSKSDIDELRRDINSLMPAFSQSMLSDSDVENILSFLNQTR
jgi:putative heme-binding domain-containing protein